MPFKDGMELLTEHVMRRGFSRVVSIARSPASLDYVLEDLQEYKYVLVLPGVYVLLDSWE